MRKWLETSQSCDPRLWQLLIMAGLLMAGVVVRDFSLKPAQIVLTFSAGLLTQAFFLHYFNLQQRGYLSAVISCFGLCLLLRCSNLWVHPCVAVLVMASKFLLRPFNQHLFNPANLGIVLGLTFFPNTWVTSGQWGADLVTALWLLAAGFFVANNAKRLDISAYFLLFYAALFLGIRVFWYGYSFKVFLHQFENGALLLFTFFMITDPLTIPCHRSGRLLHAALVAVLAYLWQFVLYKNQGIIWGLFFATFLVPLWNYIWPAPVYQWKALRHNV
jgi:enediyne biosynthesis protein E5